MRILHILHQYFPDHVGGTEHYVRSLALAQQQAGAQAILLFRQSGTGRELEREMLDGLLLYRAVSGLFSPARRFWSTLGDRFLTDCLTQVIADTRPDLVHIHHLMGLPTNTLAAGSMVAPLVVTLHDYWWVCANAQSITNYSGEVCDGPRWWTNCARCGLARAGADIMHPLSPVFAPLFAWRAAVLRRIMRRAAAWITPTAFVRDWYVARGLPERHVHVIQHGIEKPPPEVQRQTVRREGSTGARHFVYVGGLSRQKGVHVLVDAVNQLPATARLTLVGDETAFPEYCADLRRRAVHPGIQFMGRLDRTDVWRVLADADVLVVPSLWYETASLVVQEAFAVRTPVVATNHGALAEGVCHEVNGLLFPPGDVAALRQTLQRLIDDPDLLSRLRRGISPPMDMDEHVRRLEGVYRQVVPT